MFRAPQLEADYSRWRVTARKNVELTHLLRSPALMFVTAGFGRLTAAGRMCHNDDLFQSFYDARRGLAKVAAGVANFMLYDSSGWHK